MLGGRLLDGGPDDEAADEAAEAVVAMLLPLSLPLLLKPNAELWLFKLPIKGFLKGLEGVGSAKDKIVRRPKSS